MILATILVQLLWISWQYQSLFERFSNVADEIFAKLLSSFLECEVLVVVPDRCDFKFSIKAAERKRQAEDSTHMQEIEITGNQKVPTSFQSYLRNSNNKTNLGKYSFQKQKEKLPIVLTFFQTIYLTNLDSATDRVTSQSSEGIDFYCNHEEADSKIFAYIEFFGDNICLSSVTIVSLDTDVAVISLYESVTNLTFLDAIWFKTSDEDDQRYIHQYIYQLQNQDYQYVPCFL